MLVLSKKCRQRI